MLYILKISERVIVVVLILLLFFTVCVSTIELGVILYDELIKPPIFLLNIEELLEVFGFFFMILIGLELLETVKTYLSEDEIKVEIVFLVAMIAMARKVIILDLKTMQPLMLIGLAAIIISLTGGYYLFKSALFKKYEIKNNKDEK